jgi:hypothetical protein
MTLTIWTPAPALAVTIAVPKPAQHPQPTCSGKRP